MPVLSLIEQPERVAEQVRLGGAAAERVAKVVERVLYARLRQLERDARRGRRTRCEEPGRVMEART